MTDIIDRQLAAWNAGDGVSWAACFSPSATFVNIMGMPLDGRAQIGERHAILLRTLFRGSRSRVERRGEVIAAEGVVVARFEHVITGQPALPPGIQATDPDGTLRTLMLYVFAPAPAPAPDGAGWQVIAGQNTAIVPAVGSAPAPLSTFTGLR